MSLVGGLSLAAAVPAIDVKGNFFVNNATGDRYQIVGVAYQPGGSAGYDTSSDPLSHKDSCLRDAALMQVLGVNAIRVYNINPDLNHDDCVSIFNAVCFVGLSRPPRCHSLTPCQAGMYIFIDVNSPLPGESINSDAPAANYDVSYLNRTFAVVEAFKNYPNTAGFFSGNEVIAAVSDGSDVPPYIRAVTRDLKTYIAKHADRNIPVGYSAADIRTILVDSLQYLSCSDPSDGTSNDMSRVDFFALNSYSWCGNSTFTNSGYDQLVADFSSSSVPVFFSEYGCNQVYPRIFTEVPELYSDDMNMAFSGGMIYEYTQGVNNYGLVNISSDGSAQLLEDFYTLKDRYAALNFTAIQGMAPPGNSPPVPTCSSSLIDTSLGFTTDFALPGVPAGAQSLIDNGVSPAPQGQIVKIGKNDPLFHSNCTGRC